MLQTLVMLQDALRPPSGAALRRRLHRRPLLRRAVSAAAWAVWQLEGLLPTTHSGRA
jgi:hypothetical protein